MFVAEGGFLGTVKIMRKTLEVQVRGCSLTQGITGTKENIRFISHAFIVIIINHLKTCSWDLKMSLTKNIPEDFLHNQDHNHLPSYGRSPVAISHIIIP